MVGMNYRQHTDEKNAKKLYQPYLELYETGTPIESLEVESIRKDGARMTYDTSVSLIKDSEGKAIGFRAISRDITERKQVEDALKKSKEMLKLITENMSDMIRVTDLQGNNLYVSPSHFKGLGYTIEERVGKSSLDIVHPDDIETIMNKFVEGLPSNQPIRVEYRVKHADGHYVWLDTVGDLLRDDHGNATTVVMSSRDISDHKKAEAEKQSLEERLNRAEKMEALGQLAGGVAHDLNNVLGILSGYSELLLMEIPEGQRARGHAEKILQSTEKGAAIIQDLLTLARRGVTVSDVINLNDVISIFLKTPVFENIKNYHPRVTFRIECDKNLLNIKGSPVHLEKALMNLVSNAAEAIPGKGEVTIRTESRYLDKAIRGYDEVKEGDYTVLIVSDTGMGIAAENREKIFEPFYTKKTMGRSGTGLGLAIVWGTVKDHNGYIDVKTEVGEGTTFSLYFPVTREELIVSQQKVPIGQYMGKGETVLIVDDIAAQRDVASGLLKRLGYEVHTVSSGEEAVEYLKGNKADILVLDMIMTPGIDGLETYRRVLKINPKQKAILVSGYSETDRVKEAQKLGAGVYVKKPYVIETIGIAIRDELKQ
jgi:PAS domain S-box-containing protein